MSSLAKVLRRAGFRGCVGVGVVMLLRRTGSRPVWRARQGRPSPGTSIGAALSMSSARRVSSVDPLLDRGQRADRFDRPDTVRAPGRRTVRCRSRSAAAWPPTGSTFSARSTASASSTVRLPERRSSPDGLPVTAGIAEDAEHVVAQLERHPKVWCRARGRAASTSGRSAAAAAPSCSGRETV